MLPLRDTHRTTRFPIATYGIILINILIFLWMNFLTNPDTVVSTYGFIPSQPSIMTILSSMWLHGGYVHIAMNMWFLHIFGDNLEERLGITHFIGFYLVAGLCAIAAQYIINPTSTIPLIGASGAISGVAGAYYVLFPNGKIEALILTFYGIVQRVRLPAVIFLGYWFLIQVFSGVGSLVSMSANQGGVAFFAHIGGFVFGYFYARRYKRKNNILERVRMLN